MSDELLPCPFCGHPGEIEHSGEPGMLWVGCTVDDPDICMYRPMTYVTDAELADAVAVWNRRVPGAGVPVEVREAIAKSLDNSIGEITAYYQMAWSESDDEDAGEGQMTAMRNDPDLNALIDAKRWLARETAAQQHAQGQEGDA